MNSSAAGRTILWRQTDAGKTKVEELHGFPWGVPNLNERKNLGKYGWGRCSGVQSSGSGPSKAIDTVSFTLE